MTDVEIVSSSGRIFDIVDRNIQIGTKGKLKEKQFIIYRNKRYIVERDRFGMLFIYPWGLKGYK